MKRDFSFEKNNCFGNTFGMGFPFPKIQKDIQEELIEPIPGSVNVVRGFQEKKVSQKGSEEVKK